VSAPMDTTDDNAPLRWTLTRNAPLQALNTFHVQANAEQLLELHDAALLPEVLALPEVANGPLLVLGAGSNVLIAEDLPGTVLVFGNRDISFLEHRADHAVIRAGAGVPWHGLVMWSLQEGLSGLENLALIGSVGTARQLEYETDALPVGGGAMFTENTLALLSLVAVSIAGAGGGAGRFAAGVGSLLSVIFGDGFKSFGTALGFGAFMVIVLTVTQLVFRVMRVTLTEWAGDAIPVFRNMHVSTLFSMFLTLLLLLTGTWVYLWQLFGAANQLMAALSLLIVTVWLRSEKRNPSFALWPMLFMYLTTLAATIITARNLFVTIVPKGGAAAGGAWAMIIIAVFLLIASLLIGWDGFQAYQRYGKGGAAAKKATATGDD